MMLKDVWAFLLLVVSHSWDLGEKKRSFSFTTVGAKSQEVLDFATCIHSRIIWDPEANFPVAEYAMMRMMMMMMIWWWQNWWLSSDFRSLFCRSISGWMMFDVAESRQIYFNSKWQVQKGVLSGCNASVYRFLALRLATPPPPPIP